MSQKKCSKCKRDFECCNEGSGCWCESVKLDEATLADLKKQYEDCLCRECLSGLKRNK